jgi:ATP-dependent DNA helicase RecQ
MFTINRFIDEMSDPAERKTASFRLQAMVEYAQSHSCRRKSLLPYFGQAYAAASCAGCDNCMKGDAQELVDLTVPAQKFLSCVVRTGEMFGAAHIAKVLRGSKEKKVLRFKHDRLSTYGIGRDFSARQWSDMAQQFVQQGLLSRDLDHGSLKLTEAGRAVLKGRKVMGQPHEVDRTYGATRPETAEYDRPLFELLRVKRKALADAAGVPPFIVFSDRSLVDMATHFPHSEESFSTMVGIGQRKVEKYATHFLPIIQAYCGEQGLNERPKLGAGRRRSRSGRRAQLVGQAYQSGRSIQALAQELGVTPQTILKHLFSFVQAGNEIPAAGLLAHSALTAGQQAQVLAAFEEYGPAYLRPVFDALDGAVSYDELHLLRLYYLVTGDGQGPDSRA